MRIIPLAADSMGVRSMCTYVETDKTTFLIDPMISMAPIRFGHPPHPVEIWQAEKCLERFGLFARDAKNIIFTNYCWAKEFVLPAELFKDKTVFLKNPNQNLPAEERNRAFDLINQIRNWAKDIQYADSKTFSLGHTKIHFSNPFKISGDDENRTIISVCIDDYGRIFCFSSEIAGALNDDIYDFISRFKPGKLYFDGYPSYQKAVPEHKTAAAQKRLIKLLDFIKPELLLFDHHPMRDGDWEEKWALLRRYCVKSRIVFKTAAEYRGEPNNLLESRRSQLYREQPPE